MRSHEEERSNFWIPKNYNIFLMKSQAKLVPVCYIHRPATSSSLLSTCGKVNNPSPFWPRRHKKVASSSWDIHCSTRKSPFFISHRMVWNARIQREHSESGYRALIMLFHAKPDWRTVTHLPTSKRHCTSIVGLCKQDDTLVPANFWRLSMSEIF